MRNSERPDKLAHRTSRMVDAAIAKKARRLSVLGKSKFM